MGQDGVQIPSPPLPPLDLRMETILLNGKNTICVMTGKYKIVEVALIDSRVLLREIVKHSLQIDIHRDTWTM